VNVMVAHPCNSVLGLEGDISSCGKWRRYLRRPGPPSARRWGRQTSRTGGNLRRLIASIITLTSVAVIEVPVADHDSVAVELGQRSTFPLASAELAPGPPGSSLIRVLAFLDLHRPPASARLLGAMEARAGGPIKVNSSWSHPPARAGGGGSPGNLSLAKDRGHTSSRLK